MQGGLYVFQIYDHYSCSGASLLLLSIFQSVAIGWFYGMHPDSFYFSPVLFVLFLPCLPSVSISFPFIFSPTLFLLFLSFPVLTLLVLLVSECPADNRIS